MTLRILLDVDGVCTDFTGALLKQVGSSLTLKDITQWDLLALLSKDQRQQALELLKTTKFWRHLPVVAGAKEGYAKLCEAGHEICFVTSPWISCKEWGHARREWLRENFDIRNEQLVIAPDKSWLSGDAMIDDKMENLAAWDAHDNYLKRLILFDAPYNKDAPARFLRCGWSDIIKTWAKQ